MDKNGCVRTKYDTYVHKKTNPNAVEKYCACNGYKVADPTFTSAHNRNAKHDTNISGSYSIVFGDIQSSRSRGC